MTQTIQSCSWAVLNNAGKDLTIKKTETEDIRSLFLSVFDSLNDLCEKLNRLNYVLTRRNIEQGLYRKGKEESD
jgi:hypothetical protein